MTDYSGLVERLREMQRSLDSDELWDMPKDLLGSTAAAIEALAAQIDAETKLHLENESRHMALAMGWKNRIERLEGALHDLLVDYELPYWEQSGAAVGPARAALEEKS